VDRARFELASVAGGRLLPSTVFPYTTGPRRKIFPARIKGRLKRMSISTINKRIRWRCLDCRAEFASAVDLVGHRCRKAQW
jgi:hypothetical protein